MKNEKRKSQIKRSTNRSKKTRPRVSLKTNRNTKRKPQVPNKINSLYKLFLKESKNDRSKIRTRTKRKSAQTKSAPRKSHAQKTTKRKSNKRITTYRSTSKSKSTNIIRSKKTITIYKRNNLKVIRDIFSTRLKKKDQLDLALIKNQDSGLIYLVLIHYFEKLYKKLTIKKHSHAIQIEYNDSKIASAVSAQQDFEMSETNMQDQLVKTIDNLLENLNQYKYKTLSFILTHAVIRQYPI